MIIRTLGNKLQAYGRIWNGDGEYFVSCLNRIEAEYDDVEVHLHTVGGDVFAGNFIFNGLNKSTKVSKLVVDGIAASMGAIATTAIENVEIVDNGYLMIHAPSANPRGTADVIQKEVDLLRSMEKDFVRKLVAKTGLPEAKVKLWLVGDNWFDAEKCLALGLVSKIIPAVVKLPVVIEDPTALQISEVSSRYAALLTTPINKTNTIKKTNMKQPLITALGLSEVTAQSSDTAIITAVQAQLQTEIQARKVAENALADYKKGEIKALLDTAEKDKLFDATQREVYAKIGESAGVEALRIVLKSPKNNAAPNIADAIQNGSSGQPETRATWDFDKWQKEDPKGLEKLAEKSPAEYDKMFNAKYNK
ncbi:Clp protease ClpP [Tenacibaculum finnmarkense]|uniref:Clp protease ClpP n=2 Tax=Tenacibaculum finnmarkense TaxID=2781243 RepID=UPI000C58AB23|nr:Clp protease ClpP [Tenacibaculum finnmarkense]MCD8440759.1 Clp protease ClpP [Tenacibaculum finnmarkense genomovar ulcerans]MCG8721649.1 Clp protease ClpP [Tenacibaculum finnmarkense]SOS56308.1 conserved hypothetical protein [Tenacibaculum finnmarkense]